MAKYLALAVALCVALSVAAAVADEKKDEKKQDSTPEPARKGDRWEYAELHYSTLSMRAKGFANPVKGDGPVGPAPFKAKSKTTWITGDGETEGDSWEDLAAKLKAPAAAKDARPAAHKVKFLNHLGAQGWELVSNDGNAMTFKRKAK